MISGPNSELPSVPERRGEAGPTEESEIELALTLQNARPGDPAILALLAGRYTQELFQLAQALTSELGLRAPFAVDIAMLVRQVMVHAVNHVDTFWGEASVKSWLARITLEHVRRYRRQRQLADLWGFHSWMRAFPRQLANFLKRNKEIPHSAPADPAVAAAERYQVTVQGLPASQREIVILFCTLGLSSNLIAQITQRPIDQVQRHLQKVRAALLALEGGDLPKADRAHLKYRRLVEARSDGVLEEASDQAELVRHLAECSDCVRYAAALQKINSILDKAVQTCWPLSAYSPREVNRLIVSAKFRLEQPAGRERLRLARSWAWITCVVLLFLISSWLINRTLPEEDRLLAWPTSMPTPLPPPREIAAYDYSEAAAETAGMQPAAAISLDPRLSADGRWLEFVSSVDFTAGSIGTSNQSYIYNRATDQIERVDHDPTEIIDRSSSSAADLSADGQWLVTNSILPDAQGAWDGPGAKLGVVLVNRKTGESLRVDRSAELIEADGNAYLPVVSADGSWVAFWSEATNLVAGAAGTCGRTGRVSNCLNIFLFERTTGALRVLPIGRRLDFVRRYEGLSISDDGRYLALTVYADDQIAGQLAMQNMREAYVFAWRTDRWIWLNQARDGAPGNDSSYNPSISADGLHVAFYSAADNLVAGDTNQALDVFVRDLFPGTVERVSIASDGRQANGDSGLLSPEIGYSGEDIGLSADGNLVTFISSASNLAAQPEGICPPSPETGCNSVYIHDRIAGWTERVAAPQRGRFYISARISDDGLWVAYGELNTDCLANPQGVCVEVWLHDREQRWTSPVTKGRYRLPEAQWSDAAVLLERLFRVPQLAFSPDGEILAVGQVSSDVRLWSVSRAEPLAILKGESGGPVSSLAFATSGDYLAGGTLDGTVNIWRLEDRFRLYSLEGHPGRINGLAFAKDRAILAVGTPGEVWLWLRDEQYYRRKANFTYSRDFVNAMALSPDGQWLAIAATDQTVWLQHLPDGDVKLRLGGHSGVITSLAFSQDGKFLATGSQDRLVNLWQIDPLSDGSLDVTYLKTLRHPIDVRALAFSSRGDSIATVSADGLLRLWQVPDGTPLPAPPSLNAKHNREVALSPAGNGMATGVYDGDIYLWRVPEQQIEPRYSVFEPEERLDLPLQALYESLYHETEAIRTGNRWMTGSLSLDQADAASGYRLMAPISLPPGFLFQGVYLPADGSLRLDYRLFTSPGKPPLGALVLCQQPFEAGSIACGARVGANAQVEPVKIGSASAEFVRGDWLPESVIQIETSERRRVTSMEWQWDDQAPVQRLIWRDRGQLLALYYRSFDEGRPYITRSDLVAIARSVTSVTRTRQFSPVVINYTVKAGDTCTAIAERFGSSINAIERQNLFLVNACDRLYVGQTMEVPANYDLYDLGIVDLNCDDRYERLRVIALPQPREDPNIAGVIAETMAPNGFYEETWRYTIGDTRADFFTPPELFSIGSCEQLVAFNAFGGLGTTAGLNVFRWDGLKMVQVLAAEGYATGIIPQGPLAILTTSQLKSNVNQADCNQTTVLYAWDGFKYIELDRKVQGSVICGAP